MSVFLIWIIKRNEFLFVRNDCIDPKQSDTNYVKDMKLFFSVFLYCEILC